METHMYMAPFDCDKAHTIAMNGHPLQVVASRHGSPSLQ